MVLYEDVLQKALDLGYSIYTEEIPGYDDASANYSEVHSVSYRSWCMSLLVPTSKVVLKNKSSSIRCCAVIVYDSGADSLLCSVFLLSGDHPHDMGQGALCLGGATRNFSVVAKQDVTLALLVVAKSVGVVNPSDTPNENSSVAYKCARCSVRTYKPVPIGNRKYVCPTCSMFTRVHRK